MSLKDQFDSARAYVRVGDYRSARRILRQIDHPKAQEWLRKIDTLDPRRGSRTAGYALGAASLIVGMIGMFALLTMIGSPRNLGPAVMVALVCFPTSYFLRKWGKTLRE